MKPKRKIQYFEMSNDNNQDHTQEECMSINIFQKGSQISQKCEIGEEEVNEDFIQSLAKDSGSFLYSVETC